MCNYRDNLEEWVLKGLGVGEGLQVNEELQDQLEAKATEDHLVIKENLVRRVPKAYKVFLE